MTKHQLREELENHSHGIAVLKLEMLVEYVWSIMDAELKEE